MRGRRANVLKSVNIISVMEKYLPVITTKKFKSVILIKFRRLILPKLFKELPLNFSKVILKSGGVIYLSKYFAAKYFVVGLPHLA